MLAIFLLSHIMSAWDDDTITPKVLLEHMQAIRNDITGRLERLEKRIDALSSKVDKRFDSVEGRLGRVEGRLDDVERSVDKVAVQNLIYRERLDKIENVHIPQLRQAVGIR